MDQEILKNLPDAPGVYLMKDKTGRVLYIGKATSLRKRVSSYFHGKNKPRRLTLWVPKVEVVDFVPTHSEAEALIYEASMVKALKPKYNIELRDDKSYPYLKLTNEEYPRILITRKRESDGARYFGPYTNVKLLRAALAHMKRIFPLRSCGKLPKKLCVLYHIGECAGPCAGRVAKGDYARVVRELQLFLEARRGKLLKHLAARMKEAARRMNFEEALAIRNKISALNVATEGGVKISAYDEIEDLRHFLGLRRRLKRIEAFDISNISGKEAVGSMVVFIDGKPMKDEYRRFKIRTVEGINDYAMMKEVVTRRYARVIKERLNLPDLIIIDGGKGHLATACQALAELRLDGRAVIGIAKEFERIWLPGRDVPLAIHRNSPVLHLIQRVRDEAHRFAHAYFMALRRKKLLLSKKKSTKP